MTGERRLLVLASKRLGLAPGQRYRFEQWAPRLQRDHGVTLDLLPFESPRLSEMLYQDGHYALKAAWVSFDFIRRARAMLLARDYDAVVIFREAALIGPAIYERALALMRKPIIFDFDDSIWMQQPDQQNSAFSRLHFHSKTATICHLATAITAGNEFLAAYAQRHNGSVWVVPSTIELDDYPVTPEPADEAKFIICWTGSNTTLVHFEQAREALERLARHVPLVVKIICSKPPERPIAGAEMRFVLWSAENEAQELGACHAGIMPLPDNEFSRGKCGMKALQFMACSRPVVVSPVGANVNIVRDHESGFIAGSTAEFTEKLMALAESPALRTKLGSAGRKVVETSYSAAIGAEKFASVVHAIT